LGPGFSHSRFPRPKPENYFGTWISHRGASHDPEPGIFLAHDFQDMDGEPGDFTVSEGHRYPLVYKNLTIV
jgi:hypothetical protein